MFGNSCFTIVCVFGLIFGICWGKNIRPQSTGLYDPNDDVYILNNQTFRGAIFNQEHATLLEFYNSFCGHCRRYVPYWKAFATDVIAWQSAIHIAAVDCSVDENNKLCRTYEIMAYPSLRYFPPHFNETDSYGLDVPAEHEPPALRSVVVELLRNETRAPSHWPILGVINENKHSLFLAHGEQVHFIFLIYTPSNTTLANEISLDFIAYPNIAVRWINSSSVLESYDLSTTSYLSVINRKFQVYPMPVDTPDRNIIHDQILRFVKEHNLTEPSTIKPNQHLITTTENQNLIGTGVTSNQVYLHDLQQSVWFSLKHELGQGKHISGDALVALKRYINIIHRYLIVGDSGKQFLYELNQYVEGATNEIGGDQFATKYSELMAKWDPINVTNSWIGCQGSLPNYRGYTCGLWQLFHFLTVQSAADESVSDPLDALNAIHGYVKHFFGCTECSEHFQAMASENQIWQVTSKDNAILWLWGAHNQVNTRLAGDNTEDPKHPKIQFPTETSCPTCRETPISQQQINFNNQRVTRFLKEFYSTTNLNRTKSRRSVVAHSEKHVAAPGFSDLDMRIGILLYVFCMGMVVVAIKMFIRRGYRKKFYTYDYKDNV